MDQGYQDEDTDIDLDKDQSNNQQEDLHKSITGDKE